MRGAKAALLGSIKSRRCKSSRSRFCLTQGTSGAVNVVFRVQNGKLVNFPTALQWQAGDWRYAISPDGNLGAGPVQSLDGFIPWGRL